MKTPTLALIAALACSLHAQEFKDAHLIEKVKYTFGMPAKAKPGSRFGKLNLVPGGWELWVVAVNGSRVEQFGDTDMPKPPIVAKARACTEVHEALSKEGGHLVLTVVVRRPGNSRGILVEVTFSDWDAGLEYAWRKWRQNPSLYILPQTSSQVGSEPFAARVTYAEAERLEEVEAYELRKREEAEERKSPGTPFKRRESYQVAQRRLRLDAGLQRAERSDDAYLETRRMRAANLSKRAGEALEQKDWFEAHRTARAAAALGGSGAAADDVRAAAGRLTPEERGRLRVRVLSQTMKDKNPAAAAEGAAFCLVLTEGDKEAARILAKCRRSAFGEKPMAKEDLDRWLGVLGPLVDLPAPPDWKEDVLYRVTGKVTKAGEYTAVESAKVGPWIFEDKAGLKYDVGDTFTLVGFYEEGKAPAQIPDELKPLPLLKLVVIR